MLKGNRQKKKGGVEEAGRSGNRNAQTMTHRKSIEKEKSRRRHKTKQKKKTFVGTETPK
jgi:hypothetical protein